MYNSPGSRDDMDNYWPDIDDEDTEEEFDYDAEEDVVSAPR